MTRKHPQKKCRRNWTRNVLVHLARGSVAHQLPGPAQGRVRALEVVLTRHDQRPGLLREAREVGAVEEVGPRMMFRQSTQSISGHQPNGNVMGMSTQSQAKPCAVNPIRAINPWESLLLYRQRRSLRIILVIPYNAMGISFTVALCTTRNSGKPIRQAQRDARDLRQQGGQLFIGPHGVIQLRDAPQLRTFRRRAKLTHEPGQTVLSDSPQTVAVSAFLWPPGKTHKMDPTC